MFSSREQITRNFSASFGKALVGLGLGILIFSAFSRVNYVFREWTEPKFSINLQTLPTLESWAWLAKANWALENPTPVQEIEKILPPRLEQKAQIKKPTKLKVRQIKIVAAVPQKKTVVLPRVEPALTAEELLSLTRRLRGNFLIAASMNTQPVSTQAVFAKKDEYSSPKTKPEAKPIVKLAEPKVKKAVPPNRIENKAIATHSVSKVNVVATEVTKRTIQGPAPLKWTEYKEAKKPERKLEPESKPEPKLLVTAAAPIKDEPKRAAALQIRVEKKPTLQSDLVKITQAEPERPSSNEIIIEQESTVGMPQEEMSIHTEPVIEKMNTQSEAKEEVSEAQEPIQVVMNTHQSTRRVAGNLTIQAARQPEAAPKPSSWIAYGQEFGPHPDPLNPRTPDPSPPPPGPSGTSQAQTVTQLDEPLEEETGVEFFEGFDPNTELRGIENKVWLTEGVPSQPLLSWNVASKEEYWPTVYVKSSSHGHIDVPIWSSNSVEILGAFSGTKIQTSAGLVVLRVKAGWSASLEGTTARPLRFDARFEPLKDNDRTQASFLVFINQLPGSPRVFLSNAEGQEGTFHAHVLSGKLTYLDLSSPRYTTVRGTVVRGETSRFKTITNAFVSLNDGRPLEERTGQFTDRHGRFTMENVVSFIPGQTLWIETAEHQTGHVHRQPLVLGTKADVEILLFRFSSPMIGRLISQLSGGISPESGIVMGAFDWKQAGGHREPLFAEIDSIVTAQELVPEVYSLSQESQLLVGQEMDRYVPRFFAVQLSEGVKTFNLETSDGRKSWRQPAYTSPGVVTVLLPFSVK